MTQVQVAGIGSYQYQDDTKGRLSDLINPFNQTFHLEYDRDGLNTLVTQPNGTREEKIYNGRDWLTSLVLRQANGTPLDTLAYSYTDSLTGLADLTGHLRQETDGGTRVHAFHYNNLYELTQETHPDFGTLTYTYDLNGNRTSKTGSVGTNYYGVDGANKLLWVNRGANTAPTHNQANPYTLFSYDADGRTSFRERQFDGGAHRDFSFAWDGDDRLRTVKNGTDVWLSGSYDGDGTRVSKTDFWTGTHNFSWGPGGLVHDSNGTGTVHTPGFAQRQGSTDRFAFNDWLSSTRYLADSTGNSFPSAMRFDAFGNRTATGGTDPFDPSDFQFVGGFGYQTEYASATEPGVGLQLLGQRYYDPVVGRFISPDLIGFGGGLNLYTYCANNPVGLIDPLGLLSWADVGAFAYQYRQPIGWIAGGVTFLGTGGNLVAAAGVAGLTTGAIAYLGNGHDLGYAAADGAMSFVVVGEGIPAVQAGVAAVSWQLSQLENPVWAGEAGALAVPAEEGPISCPRGPKPVPALRGPRLDPGNQGKHIVGHNNYAPGRSIFSHRDPQGLLDRFAGKGEALKEGVPFGQPGYRERVDFGEEIGFHVEQGTGVATPTTRGVIHYGKGGAHIVPSRPW